jgi:hypothetical protein
MRLHREHRGGKEDQQDQHGMWESEIKYSKKTERSEAQKKPCNFIYLIYLPIIYVLYLSIGDCLILFSFCLSRV